MFQQTCISLALVTLPFALSKGDAQLWGGGGGPYVVVFQPELEVLDSQLRYVIGDGFDGNLFFLSGGYGSGSIAPNLRVGGLGAGGKSTISGNDRQATLSLGYGGFLTEYVVPWRRFQFFVGGVLGGGNIGLKISRASRLSWSSFWDNFAADSVSSANFSGDLSATFFYGEAYLGFQYAVTPWAYVKIDVGYPVMRLGSASWKESSTRLTGAPDMVLSAPFVRVGVYFGYFGSE